jgi:hypothetical protein
MVSFKLASLSELLLLTEVILLQMFLPITMSYTIRTKRFILRGRKLLSLHNLVVYLFIHSGLEIGQGLPLLQGISGRAAGMVTGSIAGCLWSRKPMFGAREFTC